MRTDLLPLKNYLNSLNSTFELDAWNNVQSLCERLEDAKNKKKSVFIFGNGGSAANALHLANDLIFGEFGLDVEALPSNSSVITCLANDLGYEHIFSEQLRIKGRQGDLAIALSGSGRSKNIIEALRTAKKIGMNTISVTAFDGGEARILSDLSIHFPIKDMQIAEDLQLIIGHICMKHLQNKLFIA